MSLDEFQGEHVLAVVPVSDVEVASAWYEKLLGRPADNNPMPVLVGPVVTGGWVQVWVDTERAGSGLLNLAVDDPRSGWQHDPLIGSFRVEY